MAAPLRSVLRPRVAYLRCPPERRRCRQNRAPKFPLCRGWKQADFLQSGPASWPAPSVYPVSRCRRWIFALRRAPVRPRITADPSIFPSQRSSVSEPGQRQARRCVKGRDPANFSRTRTWLRPPVGGQWRQESLACRTAPHALGVDATAQVHVRASTRTPQRCIPGLFTLGDPIPSIRASGARRATRPACAGSPSIAATRPAVGRPQRPPWALPVPGRPPRRSAVVPSCRRPTGVSLVSSRRAPPRFGPGFKVRLQIAHVPAKAVKHRTFARPPIALERARRKSEPIGRMARGEKHSCRFHVVLLVLARPGRSRDARPIIQHKIAPLGKGRFCHLRKRPPPPRRCRARSPIRDRRYRPATRSR